MKSYEHETNGRVLCMSHNMLRCSECEYVHVLEKQNQRLREALEFYADEENYEDLGHGEHAITYDGGDEARQALKEEK